MEVLLIDVGALAIFFGYMAIVYWHGVSDETESPGRRLIDVPHGAGRAKPL
jgi:hypothetical protein